jgi:hypothetical protein
MKQTVNILSIVAIFLTAFQGSISMMPGDTTIVSAVVMFLVTGVTAWKQAFCTEINSKALTPTIIIAIIATLGGFNELIRAIPFSEVAAQWIRLTITTLVMSLNLLSKYLWPTDSKLLNK